MLEEVVKSYVSIILIIAGFTVFILAVMYLLSIGNRRSSFLIAKSAPQLALSNWKTYKDKRRHFCFKYPAYFNIAKEISNGVSLGKTISDDKREIIYLTISTNPMSFLSYKSYPLCSNGPTRTTFPCLEDAKESGWGQSENIMKTKLRGEDAISFYLANSQVDEDYHVIQTTSFPHLQAKMLVSGGGLDATFEQILSTFQFINP